MANNDEFFKLFKCGLTGSSDKRFKFRKTNDDSEAPTSNALGNSTVAEIPKYCTSGHVEASTSRNSQKENSVSQVNSRKNVPLNSTNKTSKLEKRAISFDKLKSKTQSSPSLLFPKKPKAGDVFKQSSTKDSAEDFDMDSFYVNSRKNQSTSRLNETVTKSSLNCISPKDNKIISFKKSIKLSSTNVNSSGASPSVVKLLDSPCKKISPKKSPDKSAKMKSQEKPQKFTFKKKIFDEKSSVSVEEENNKQLGKSLLNEQRNTPSKQEGTKRNLSTNSMDSPTMNSSFGQLNLNNKVTNLVDSLQATENDYMDDEEFERFLGNTSKNSSLVKATDLGDYLDDEIDLADIDWDSEIPLVKKTNSEEVADLLDGVDFEDFTKNDENSASGFSSRVDNSREFVGNYPHSSVMNEVLHTRFGLRTFRPHQREICNASLTGHDIFVLMPTGGGKSLCYQLPATLTPGVTIVISPLRSLISDQVDKLNALDIPAGHLCADQSKEETDLIMSKLYMREPEIKLLFLTPEKISASRTCSDLLDHLYSRDKLARFIIDEAHCLSQWGHDFRPDYKQLSMMRVKYPKVAIACLTATATKQVEGDVINILSLRNVKTFIRSFNRPNIKYKVIHKNKSNVIDEIAALIKSKFAKKSGIVYCLSRDDCEKVAEYLKQNGVPAMPYHAGMSSKVRDAVQRQWMQDRYNVIVGTIAFGMGIDKPDVRFVIHNTIPKSVEAFYQESGRAGRDGETSHSFLFYSYNDVKRLQKIMMLEKSNRKALDGHFEALKQMVAYCENHVDCRRYLQLIHLGERFDRQICIRNKETTCDNCEQSKSFKRVDVTHPAKDLCQLIRDFTGKGDKVTLSQIADVYKGSKAKKLIERQHDKHPLFAKGAALGRIDIQRILKQLLMNNILSERCEYAAGFPVVYIQLGKKYASVNMTGFDLNITVSNQEQTLRSNSKATLTTSKTKGNQASTSTSTPTPNSPVPSTSTNRTSTPVSLNKHEISLLRVRCHEELLEECRRLALDRNMTLSSIMNLSAIKKMSDVLPKTKDEMLKIQHVTTANYEKYGDYFLKISTKYRAELDEKTRIVAAPAVLPSNAASTSLNDDDDWWYSSQSSCSAPRRGVKRKSYGFKRGGAKRYKKGRKTARKTSPKKGGTTRKGLGMMPVLHVS